MILLVRAQEIKFLQIENSPGILPFKLGTANIVTKKHIFLYDINVGTLKAEINNLNKIYYKLNSSLNAENPPYFYSLRNNYIHLNEVIQEINQKFANIMFYDTPKIVRQKRGLINLGGSLQKFLFGTLDANDGERYENALKTLRSNQQNIVKQVNSQISLSKSLIDRYSRTIDSIVSNQHTISNFITNYSHRLQNITNEFYRYTLSLSMINQIFMNANIIITFLDNIENAITFAKLHVTHPDILTQENLNEILLELSQNYQQNELLKLGSHSWFSIIQTNCHFSENNIIFAIEIPIVYPKTFKYFHLIPFPTSQNSIIIPKLPYLALEETSYQYMEEPCIKVENNYICNQENLERNVATDCIATLIQNGKPKCRQTPIEPPQLIFEKINDEYLVIISKEEIQVQTYCPDENYHSVRGNILAQIPVNCSLRHESYKFGNYENTKASKPLLLPKFEEIYVNYSKPDQPLKIEAIPLQELHQLRQQIEAVKPLSIADWENTSSNWEIWTSIGVIAAIIFGYYIYKMKKPFTKNSAPKGEKEENPTTSPSVFFQPEDLS